MNNTFSFFDLHIHANPDTFIRRYSAVSLGDELKKSFAAGVLKSHSQITTGIAYTMRLLGYPIYGSIVLNPHNGGLNLNIVKSAIAANGTNQMIIYFPTTVNNNHVSKMKQNKSHDILDEISNQNEFISYNNTLTKEAIEIIKLASYYNIPIATGHSNKKDVFLLADEIEKNNGKLILTHPLHPLVNLTIDEVKELLKYKHTYSEFTILMSILKYENISHLINLLNSGYEDQICISSDLGQLNNMTVTEGYKWFKVLLQKANVNETIIDKIYFKNAIDLINLNQHY